MKPTTWMLGLLALWLTPVCHAQSNAPLVAITNGWVIPSGELPRPEIYRDVPARQFLIRTAQITDLVPRQGRIWLGIDYSVIVPPEFNLGQGFDFRAVFVFDPDRERTEPWSGAMPQLVKPVSNGVGMVILPSSGRFDVDADALWVYASSNLVHRYDLKTRARREFRVDLLDGLAPRVTALKGKIFLRTNDRFLELDPATGLAQLLASARRRPAVNPLDEAGNFDRFLLETNVQGRVCLLGQVPGQEGEVRFTGWARTADGAGWEPVALGDRPSFGTRPAGDARLAYDASLNDSRVLALTPGSSGESRLLLGPAAQAPHWGYPADYPPRQNTLDYSVSAFLSESGLLIFSPPASADRFHPMRGGMPLLPGQGRLPDAAPTGTAATLRLFRDAWEEPVVRHLGLGPLVNGDAELKLSPLSGTNLAVFRVPAGLLVIPSQFAGPYGLPVANGFWWIPARQIERWIAEDADAGTHTPRCQPRWLAAYDHNHDGRLDAVEQAQLQADPEFHRLEAERAASAFLHEWDRNGDGGLDHEEMEASCRVPGASPASNPFLQVTPFQRQNLLDTSDTNHNARLELPELVKLFGEEVATVRRQIAPLNLPPNLRQFDLNGDGKLDAAEKAAADKAREEVIRASRLGAARPYDHNGDGKLDEAEEAEFKQRAPNLYEFWKRSQKNLPPPMTLPGKPQEKK